MFRCDRDMAFELMRHLTWVLSQKKLPPQPQLQYLGQIGQCLGLDSEVINDFLRLARRRIEDVIAENQIKKSLTAQQPTYVRFNLKL